MPHCVGVAFKRVAKSYWFDANGIELREGDQVIVETSRGLALGVVRIGPQEVPEEELQAPLQRVLRRAEAADLQRERELRQKAQADLAIFKEGIRQRELPMKALYAEYTFDGEQLTFYFSSETRVDFRDLVRDLVARLKVRVMLYQVGARDETKMLGGIGPCGRTLCCATFLTEFASISMKMAKDQSLFLNPVKFSGICGKLMCCLRYEHETYVEAREHLPPIGQLVMSPRGQGKVVELNLLKETAIVQLLESGAEMEFPATELRIEKTTRCSECRGCQLERMREELAEENPSEE
ncbi:MAG TPA: regulatory iron-sulfur-containing complex subunit RicT [Chthonomonas sp.]|jgi:cell fate regulator YaaT (PSP1 superfamily)|uniref:PSP1 domain-containing protein n=1 Tax=Chthonomonas sp. TaxID=2282153 RepID=UPI002B4B2613|nr:regulatory iron-sulfur-containing complex subunit RicT [Chthonomonas sp.]HLH81575.1 regulatory iron-sulfur-containing complex subunit RicT [Chthonomonas sp.]